MVRAFVALELSKDIKDQLSAAQDAIRKSRARLTFVDPKNIHITVKFLGEVDEKTLQKVKEALKSVTSVPFSITAGTVMVNNPRRPHTIWSAIDDAGQIRNVFLHIEDVLAPLGFDRETRNFTPHATLARVKSPDPSLLLTLDTLKMNSYGSCVISGLKLKKSTLLPQGPVYQDLLEVTW